MYTACTSDFTGLESQPSLPTSVFKLRIYMMPRLVQLLHRRRDGVTLFSQRSHDVLTTFTQYGARKCWLGLGRQTNLHRLYHALATGMPVTNFGGKTAYSISSHDSRSAGKNQVVHCLNTQKDVRRPRTSCVEACTNRIQVECNRVWYG